MNNNWKFKFFSIWFGQAISILSSSILQMALIWHLTTTTKSAMMLSIASIAGFLPTAILGSFTGVLVDRWNRKRVMMGADIYIAIISLILVINAVFTEVPTWIIMLVLFLRSIGTSFHSPALSAITPLIVPESELTKCAGYSQSVQTVGYIAGTAIAGILYPIWSIGGMVALDIFGAAFACITVAFIKIPAPAKMEQQERTSILSEMRAGYQVFHEQKGLFDLLWIGAIFMFVYSPINALFPLLSMNYFGGTTTHASIAEIAFSLGMLGGGLLLGKWGGLKDRVISILSAMALMGLAIGFSGILPVNGFIIFAILCVAMGIAVPFYSGSQVALMQEKFAPEYLGRVFGLYGSIMSLAMPIGLIISAMFADVIGVHRWFLLSGLASLVLAVFAYFIPSIRNLDRTCY